VDAAVSPASIALSIAFGTSILAAFLIIWAGMRSQKGASRDTASSIMLGVAFLLMLAILTAGALVGTWGMAYLGLAKAALLLTAAFAVVGIGFGLVRGLRSGRAIHIE
jgi:uncharacterized protein YqgC (DUF456 family)